MQLLGNNVIQSAMNNYDDDGIYIKGRMIEA